MTNANLDLCLKCDHPKSEHVNGGCNYLTPLRPQEHGNPESQLCICNGFFERKGSPMAEEIWIGDAPGGRKAEYHYHQSEAGAWASCQIEGSDFIDNRSPTPSGLTRKEVEALFSDQTQKGRKEGLGNQKSESR